MKILKHAFIWGLLSFSSVVHAEQSSFYVEMLDRDSNGEMSLALKYPVNTQSGLANGVRNPKFGERELFTDMASILFKVKGWGNDFEVYVPETHKRLVEEIRNRILSGDIVGVQAIKDRVEGLGDLTRNYLILNDEKNYLVLVLKNGKRLPVFLKDAGVEKEDLEPQALAEAELGLNEEKPWTPLASKINRKLGTESSIAAHKTTEVPDEDFNIPSAEVEPPHVVY